MNRMTQRIPDSGAIIASNLEEKHTAEKLIDLLCERLAMYEDTALEPGEVFDLKKVNDDLAKNVQELTDRVTSLRTQLERYDALQRNGQLQIAPCAIGQKIFVLFHGYIEPTTVIGVMFSKDCVRIDTTFGSHFELNKDAFLTSSEAEAERNRRCEECRRQRNAAKC